MGAVVDTEFSWIRSSIVELGVCVCERERERESKRRYGFSDWRLSTAEW